MDFDKGMQLAMADPRVQVLFLSDKWATDWVTFYLTVPWNPFFLNHLHIHSSSSVLPKSRTTGRLCTLVSLLISPKSSFSNIRPLLGSCQLAPTLVLSFSSFLLPVKSVYQLKMQALHSKQMREPTNTARCQLLGQAWRWLTKRRERRQPYVLTGENKGQPCVMHKTYNILPHGAHEGKGKDMRPPGHAVANCTPLSKSITYYKNMWCLHTF